MTTSRIASDVLSAFALIQERYLRAAKIPDAKLVVPASLWKQHAEDHAALLAEKEAGMWDLFDHLSVPSRENPVAAAFAVNARKMESV